MGTAWMHMVGPYDSEPDYNAYWHELESLETIMANVGSYDDWFPESDDGWVSLDGFVDPPAAPEGFVTQVK